MFDTVALVLTEGAVGTSKRYAESIDRKMDQRILERHMAEHEPLSLTDDELELKTEPLTRAPVPRPVRAWVRYGTLAVKVDAEVVAWTERAVAIRWKRPDGHPQRAWVWASAVEPVA